jgi:hypothetical protein
MRLLEKIIERQKMDSIRIKLVGSVIATQLAPIVADFLTIPDYSQLDPLTFNDQGVCTNPAIRKLTKQALSDPGCEIKYKMYILTKAAEFDYQSELKTLISELLLEGYQLNLDGIECVDLDLSGLNMSGGKFSAVNADLNGVNLTGSNIDGGFLRNTQLHWAELAGLSMVDVETEKTSVIVSKTDFFKVVSNEKTRKGMDLTLMES